MPRICRPLARLCVALPFLFAPLSVEALEAPDERDATDLRFEPPMSDGAPAWPNLAEPGTVVDGASSFSGLNLAQSDLPTQGSTKGGSASSAEPGGESLDPTAEPAFGRLAMPDSGVAEISLSLAGGTAADEVEASCVGNIAMARPDVTLSVHAPEPALTITATSDFDTTLVVVAPDGAVLCNDDLYSFDPVVEITDAAPGVYAIWVGIHGSDAGVEAVVSVGRAAPEAETLAESTAELDISAEPAFGRHELPGEGSLELPVLLAGGVIHAGDAAPGCSGEIDPARPDVVIALPAGEATVWFRVASEGADTTLVVVGPDGAPICNDDFDGVSPAVGVNGAAPGDYAIWVGSYGGGAGVQATLMVGRDAPAGGAGEPMLNPFIGQPLESAADALALLVESLGLGDILTYERLEETGPEGLILHGVVLNDPAGVDQPVRIGQVRVSDLDLAGLAAYGAPERFALAFDGISYESVAAGARSNLLPVPLLEAAPPFSFSFSLLPPDGDASRRELRFDLALDEQMSIAVAAGMLWQEGMAAMGPAATFMMAGDSLEMELHDMGFLGAVLREIAAESGEGPDAMVAVMLGELAGGLGPLEPGAPRTRLYEAVSAMLGDLNRSGVLRIRLSSAEPSDVETLFEALMADTLDESQFSLEVTYQPDP